MTKKTWEAFTAAREHYRKIIKALNRNLPELQSFQQVLVDMRPGPAYRVETPILYNLALDEVIQKDEIRLILIADNPGRREQMAENRRYLVGPSGKIAEKFFREHPEMDIDFRKNVLILNKTPVHTPRTAELRELFRLGGPAVTEAIAASQQAMAELLLEFHRILAPAPVWITGYSEMRKGGIFETYTVALKKLYAARPALRKSLLLYRHFSMNQFTIDLRQKALPGEMPGRSLERIGKAYRERILGW
ncbi:MAG: hypothetical protein LBT16_04110 [Treponema sp.]|jgi:hypothetical protein|nr:hypothetical protein [Treponema sp.]